MRQLLKPGWQQRTLPIFEHGRFRDSEFHWFDFRSLGFRGPGILHSVRDRQRVYGSHRLCRGHCARHFTILRMGHRLGSASRQVHHRLRRRNRKVWSIGSVRMRSGRIARDAGRRIGVVAQKSGQFRCGHLRSIESSVI